MNIFKSSKEYPYHLSVGAVLVNDEGKICTHYFKSILKYEDVYILMRETVKNGESIMGALERGLMEEFGAKAEIVHFLGSLQSTVKNNEFSFLKTTIYFLAKLKSLDENKRSKGDLEGESELRFMDPVELESIMKKQGKKYTDIDSDESLIVRNYINNQYLN